MHGDSDRENVRNRGEEQGREARSKTEKCNVRQGAAARGTETPLYGETERCKVSWRGAE